MWFYVAAVAALTGAFLLGRAFGRVSQGVGGYRLGYQHGRLDESRRPIY
jgi:hypothetical protein